VLDYREMDSKEEKKSQIEVCPRSQGEEISVRIEEQEKGEQGSAQGPQEVGADKKAEASQEGSDHQSAIEGCLRAVQRAEEEDGERFRNRIAYEHLLIVDEALVIDEVGEQVWVVDLVRIEVLHEEEVKEVDPEEDDG